MNDSFPNQLPIDSETFFAALLTAFPIALPVSRIVSEIHSVVVFPVRALTPALRPATIAPLAATTTMPGAATVPKAAVTAAPTTIPVPYVKAVSIAVYQIASSTVSADFFGVLCRLSL